MRLHEARQIAESLLSQMSPFCERAEIAGSIRREKPEVKDIESVAVPKWRIAPIAEQVESLFAWQPRDPNVNPLHFWAVKLSDVRWIKPGTSEIIAWTIKPDGKYWRGILPSDIKLDLFIATPDNWGIIFAIRTGSAEFTTALVTHAKQIGMPSVDGYLTRNGQQLRTAEEIEVFNLLGLEYVEPSARIDGRAIRRKP